MAPTLTTTARVRLRPPKPPPRLVEPPRTTSNGHRKQAPDVVAAAKLTLATLRAGDARAARRRCLRAGFHALRVGVANERLERAATAVRRREAAAEHAAAAIRRREAAAVAGEVAAHAPAGEARRLPRREYFFGLRSLTVKKQKDLFHIK